LDLGGNEVGNYGAVALARALAAPRPQADSSAGGPQQGGEFTNDGLLVLSLASNAVGDAGAEALAAAVLLRK